MSLLSPLQMTDASTWKGLTTENHLGALWLQQPQMVSDMITKVQATNFGNNIDTLLSQFKTLEFDDDRDYTWLLSSNAVDNIPLIEARIDGTAVVATDQAGKNFTAFQLVFAKDWFDDTQRIVGEKNELYPILITEEPAREGANFVYTCRLDTGDPNLYIPFEEIALGKRFSGEFSPVERTMSEKGRQVHHKGHMTMRNAFSQIRMMKKTPGNLKGRKMGGYMVGPDDKPHAFWQDYESYMFDFEFRQDINRLIMFGTANRTAEGGYEISGKSGYKVVEGAGIRQQMLAANAEYYNTFSIDDLTERLMDLSEGKIPGDMRHFTIRTGERGALQFHKALESNSQLYTPLLVTDRVYKASTPAGGSNYQLPLGYGGQFVEYLGPNGIKVSLQVDSMYDNRDRNKIYHPDGGVAESYRMEIMDIGTNDGMPNIQKVAVKGQSNIHKYIPGLRNPFDPDGGISPIGSAVDAWEEHKMYVGGAIVRDPSRTASFIPNILA